MQVKSKKHRLSRRAIGKKLTLEEKQQKRQEKRAARKKAKEARAARQKAQQELRASQLAEGLVPRPSSTLPNRISSYKTVEEEQAAREDAASEQLRIFRDKLPVLLRRLNKITDCRNPKKIKHKLAMLMIYGILMFVHQMSSRRECNRQMTKPTFLENLRLLFPELESLPHQDTLNRVLSQINVDELESCLLDLIQRLIRNKKFNRYLINNCYPIAIDGTQKMVRTDLLSDEWQQRAHEKPEGIEIQYNVYVLEANLAFQNGMVIPLLSEFLDYTQGDIANDKQDCETRAFYRLAKRLKKTFSHLRIMLLLDGIYAQGPIIEQIRRYKWDFMIVLQDKSLPAVWEDYKGLRKLHSLNNFKMDWGNRHQTFQWVNDIEYYFGPKEKKIQTIHVVVCKEQWKEIDPKTNKPITKESKHAWISSAPLDKRNMHERCNLGARHRWGIETSNLVEKKHGYNYEHCYSTNWNAMRGYHYLMRLGHAINILAHYSTALISFVKEMGFRGLIKFVWETLSVLSLNHECVRKRLTAPFQLRLE